MTSALTWRSPARWGETVDVDVDCPRTGRTSFTLAFTVRVGERVCCTVETVYVHTDGRGTPHPLDDADRAALRADRPASPPG